MLGELALITAMPRSVSVRAGRASDLLAVDRSAFEELLDTAPALSRALNRALAQELRESRAEAPTARPRAATVALFALDEHVPLADLTRRLAEALEHHLAPALLDGSELAVPEAGARPAAVYGPLLDRAEAAHDLVLLEGGSALSGDPWTEFCVQQADRILVVTAGGPVPGALGERPELRGCDLVAYDVSPRIRRAERVGGGARSDRVPSDPERRVRGRPGTRRAAPERTLGRDRAVRRRRAGVRAHRRARGAARRPGS